MGCANATPSLTVDDPIFSEPSCTPSFRDGATFRSAGAPRQRGDARESDQVDLTRDQPDNVIHAER